MNILKSKGKYFICTICTVLMAMILFAPSAFGLEYEATVIAPEAIIRQEKTFDSKQLDKLDIGVKATVKEISDDWYYVEIPDGQNKGWVSSHEMVISDSSFKEGNLKRGYVTASVLNVRLGPSTGNARITQICRGDKVTIINTYDRLEKWYEVILTDNIKGWVHSDYIETTYNLPKGNINVDSIILKQQPYNDAANVIKLEKNNIVYIKNYLDGWYNIITSSDMEGWVNSKHVTVTVGKKTGNEVFDNIEAVTTKYLGKRYIYGGNGPNSFDCSGFASYILKTYYGGHLRAKGINNFPRTCRAQAKVGTAVDRANLQKGDLVFFDTSGNRNNNISHVGIYLGDGKIIHASTSRSGIVTDSLSSRYYNTRFVKATRL